MEFHYSIYTSLVVSFCNGKESIDKITPLDSIFAEVFRWYSSITQWDHCFERKRLEPLLPMTTLDPMELKWNNIPFHWNYRYHEFQLNWNKILFVPIISTWKHCYQGYQWITSMKMVESNWFHIIGILFIQTEASIGHNKYYH